jgi:hypothetical protein
MLRFDGSPDKPLSDRETPFYLFLPVARATIMHTAERSIDQESRFEV